MIGIPPAEPGIMPPGTTAPSQQGAELAAGPHGSHTGPQGAAIGAWHGSDWRPHGERNSMKEGRRQLLPPPKQLLQPGAAARQARPSTRQMVRDMRDFSSGRKSPSDEQGGGNHGGVAATTETLAHDFARGGPGPPKVPQPNFRGCVW